MHILVKYIYPYTYPAMALWPQGAMLANIQNIALGELALQIYI
jgi:hypothetical protein